MPHPRRALALAAAVPLLLGLAPLPDATSPLGATTIVDDADPDATFAAPNVRPVGAFPAATVISVAFASDAPVMYASTLTGVQTYDVSEPTRPRLLGAVPLPVFQNENVKLGERDSGEKFVLVGFDTIGLTPTTDPTDVGTYDEFAVVEVTDPTAPEIVARVEVGSDTHTVGCADRACSHAYTSGRDGRFDVVDLTDFRDPQVLEPVTEQPMGPNEAFATGLGHDWDVDDAGVAWWVGTGGIIAYDVEDPADPRILNTSDAHGTDPAWNGFILHNTMRPNAAGDHAPGSLGLEPPRARPDAAAERGRADGAPPWRPAPAPVEPDGPHVDRGDVLLVTEEDYLDVTCASEGSFQTWHVPELDGLEDGEPGTITPLDDWNTELLGTGMPTPAGAFCSAHYFDYHQDGYVAQGWYQQGLRILDVNDATDIRQVGYWVTGMQETWGAVWVPEYDAEGQQTGDKLDLLYTQDPTRGLEILAVDLPDERGAAPTVTAPVLGAWLDVPAAAGGLTAPLPGGGSPPDEASPLELVCRLPSVRGG